MASAPGRAERPATTLVRWGGGIVGALVLVALGAPWISPYPPDSQSLGAANRPPGTVLVAVELTYDRWLLGERVQVTPEGVMLENRGRRQLIPASEVLNLTADGVTDRRRFLLGTDRFGRDLLSRLLHGARVSLTVALLAMALALTLGIGIGALAAVGGPLVDGALMRAVDGLLAFPRLFLLMALAALLRPSNTALILILGCTAWMGISRVVRAELRSLREREFVLAARAAGVSPLGILWRHLLPNAASPILAYASLLVGSVILAESALAFLGLGLQPPQASWGNILNDGRDVLTTAPWVSVIPGFAIALAVIGFNLLADGLRNVLDPRYTS